MVCIQMLHLYGASWNRIVWYNLISLQNRYSTYETSTLERYRVCGGACVCMSEHCIVAFHEYLHHTSVQAWKKWVKVQFRGPKLYKKKGAPFQEESHRSRIFKFSSLNLHTFHLINIVLWWRIFFRKHGKSTPNDRQDHHVLVADFVIMTSQCRCTRALSQSHVAKHDNHVPVTPLTGSGLAVISVQWLPYGKNRIGKNNDNDNSWKHKDTR